MLGGGDASVMSPKDAPKVLSTASALASAWGCNKAVGCPKRGQTPHGPRLAARMAPGWGSCESCWPKINPLVLGHPIHSTASLVRDDKPSASS